MRQAPKRALLEKVVVVIGPTASGKTDLAVGLARELGGEVVSADSRQVYRRLDAGTAKPERDSHGRVEGIPYHLTDVVDPVEPFDAGRYARMAQTVMADIRGRGRMPVIAGGTGLYIRALCEGLSEIPKSDAGVRARLQSQGHSMGSARLHSLLRSVDPQAADAIPANNIQRVLRALEVYELTGKPISSFWRKEKTDSSGSVYLRIDWTDSELKDRIRHRAEIMWPKMLAQTRALLEEGFSGVEPGFQSLGYHEAVQCLKGELSSEDGLAGLVSATNRYAKRQRTWFRNQTRGAIAICGGSLDAMLAQSLEALGVAAALPR